MTAANLPLWLMGGVLLAGMLMRMPIGFSMIAPPSSVGMRLGLGPSTGSSGSSTMVESTSRAIRSLYFQSRASSLFGTSTCTRCEPSPETTIHGLLCPVRATSGQNAWARPGEAELMPGWRVSMPLNRVLRTQEPVL